MSNALSSSDVVEVGKPHQEYKERLSIALLADEGLTNEEIVKPLPFGIHKVARWRNRFAELGQEGIEKDRPRGRNQSGANSAKQAKQRERVIEYTTNKEKLPINATHWVFVKWRRWRV